MRSLTIIIPVYNAQSYIVNLAKHLNEQTCKDFVAIFIDDASTDDSVKVLHDISEQADFEMVVHQQAKNGGPGKARNGEGLRAIEKEKELKKGFLIVIAARSAAVSKKSCDIKCELDAAFTKLGMFKNS